MGAQLGMMKKTYRRSMIKGSMNSFGLTPSGQGTPRLAQFSWYQVDSKSGARLEKDIFKISSAIFGIKKQQEKAEIRKRNCSSFGAEVNTEPKSELTQRSFFSPAMKVMRPTSVKVTSGRSEKK